MLDSGMRDFGEGTGTGMEGKKKRRRGRK